MVTLLTCYYGQQRTCNWSAIYKSLLLLEQQTPNCDGCWLLTSVLNPPHCQRAYICVYIKTSAGIFLYSYNGDACRMYVDLHIQCHLCSIIFNQNCNNSPVSYICPQYQFIHTKTVTLTRPLQRSECTF